MSSLRKYLKRKSYRERTQPSSRKRLGLLEKHKDYVERAQKHHEQTAELERLQREAEERNPNEFHFSMEHERTRGGIPISIEKKRTPEEEIMLKSKDLSFINMRIQQETKRVEKLRAKLHLLGCESGNRHVIFVESPTEAEKLSEAQYFQTPKECINRRFNRPRQGVMKDQLILPAEHDDPYSNLEEFNTERAKQYDELNARVEMLEALRSLANELWLKRELAKGEEHKKVTLPDGTTAVKWKKIRK